MRRAGIIAVLLIATGCHMAITRNRTQPASTPGGSHSVGGGVTLPTPTPASAQAKPANTFNGPLFVLRLTDPRALHPAGIPVRISGPTNAVIRTDLRGEISLSRAGIYHFAVVSGCTDAVEVFSGGTGTAGVTSDRTSHGELRVDWRHRFTPAPPVFSNPQGPWPKGTDVRVQFNVIDRCKQTFAPNAAYPTFRFATSKNLVVSKPPILRSNAKSQGSVTVRCSSAGAVKLIAVDGADPPDQFDIARESSDFSRPSCGS